jgi:hypothetical protein
MVLSTVRVRVAVVNMRQAPRAEGDRASEAIRVLPTLLVARGREYAWLALFTWARIFTTTCTREYAWW